MRISVVIPAYNAARTLRHCLRAWYVSTYNDFEVVLVDDGSTDATAEIAAGYPCWVLRNERNLGAAVAKNRGAATATGEVVLFADADVIARPDTLALVAESFADPKVAGVVGLLDAALPYPEFASQFKNLWMRYTYARLPEYVGVFYTSLAAARRDLFLALGGFDEHYTGASVTEDIEFGMRLLSAGHRVRLDKRLQVVHLKRYTLGGLIRTDLERSAGLTKTMLRNRLARTGPRYYASVPWFFQASVPLSGLGLAALVAWPASGSAWAGLAALALWVSITALNWPFLRYLWQARGVRFGLQSVLFLPLNLWVSLAGALLGAGQFALGRRY